VPAETTDGQASVGDRYLVQLRGKQGKCGGEHAKGRALGAPLAAQGQLRRRRVGGPKEAPVVPVVALQTE
jgi:hypothetical protein